MDVTPMDISTVQWSVILPEIFILSMAFLVLLVDVFLDEQKRIITYGLTQIALLGTVALIVNQDMSATHIMFEGTFISDGMANILKIAICTIIAIVFLYSREYLQIRGLHKGEYYVLGLFSTLGMMVMVSAASFLTMYLGLELLSLSLYAIVALDRDSGVASEAAMKYFVLGALASGMLLYGISIFYGVTAQLNFAEMQQALSTTDINHTVLLLGISFIIVGLAFKLGAVPFHMWVPDVYQGANTPVTLFIATAPKLAVFAMLMRIMVDGFANMHADWQGMLIVLVILSLAVGNVIAIAQTNIKRMLAYSTIAHISFVLLGVLSGSADGYSAAMFYSIVYALMTLGAFGMVVLLSRQGFEAEELDDFKGLNQKSPWFAFLMLIIMFSMAGVPPMVGFHAKLAVLHAVVQADLTWLAVVTVLFSVIGAFYYLRVVKLMYFDEPSDSAVIEKQIDFKCLMSINGLAVLGLGLFPASLMSLCIAVLA